jgi:hypothetical protein
MISISVTIADVTTEFETDNVLSFDAIETLLSRASTSSLNAYALYTSMPEPIGDFDRDDE